MSIPSSSFAEPDGPSCLSASFGGSPAGGAAVMGCGASGGAAGSGESRRRSGRSGAQSAGVRGGAGGSRVPAPSASSPDLMDRLSPDGERFGRAGDLSLRMATSTHPSPIEQLAAMPHVNRHSRGRTRK